MPLAIGATAAIGCEASLADYVALLKPRVMSLVVLTGLTGTFVIPSVLYFQALAMERELMIQTMGVWFLVATASLGAALGAQGLMPANLSALSAAALVPALAGMWLGQRIRRSLSEARFRRLFFTALLLLGAYIAMRAFLS